jgi:hypothetical protein
MYYEDGSGTERQVSIGTALRSETTAWVLGAAAVGGVSAFAFSLVGWIGIGIIGLLGLVISASVALHSGHSVAVGELGTGDVRMYARQLDEAGRSRSSPEEKMAAAAIQAKRSKVLYLINTVFITMMVLGFGAFFFYQI